MKNYNDLTTATAQFIERVNSLPDATCRRWSYEIEAVGLGAVSNRLQSLNMTTSNDPSITDDDCVCDCDQCDHSCDCNNCSISNGWDENEHCAECQETEACPSDHRPCVTTHDSDRLAPAMEALNRVARIDETCGGHVHVDATGATTQSMAVMLQLWLKVDELLPDLIGRPENHYAQLPTAYQVADARQGNGIGRYQSVNIENAQRNLGKEPERQYKNTIEFRQFGGTLSHEIVIARGFICRAIVEMAIARKPIYWALSATTPEALLKALDLGN